MVMSRQKIRMNVIESNDDLFIDNEFSMNVLEDFLCFYSKF